MNKYIEETEHAEQELQSAYLCGCRLLQWMAERLSVDRKSCMMRRMDQGAWYNACSFLVDAGIIDSRLALRVPISEASRKLQKHFDARMEEVRLARHCSRLREYDEDNDPWGNSAVGSNELSTFQAIFS